MLITASCQTSLPRLALLALPQILLSLGNFVPATRQLTNDLFPKRGITIRKNGLTCAVMNLLNPWLGGIPTCHGSGGMDAAEFILKGASNVERPAVA